MALDDDDALASAAAIDPQAFASIYERHHTSVFRYLRSRTQSDEEAGELSAVTFERALVAIGRFKSSGGGMLAWLLRIARNAHLDDARRSARRAPAQQAFEPEASSATPGLELEDGAVLRGLVDALPQHQRDAVQLRFAAGLTAREIGAVLGMSEVAAQKQLERAVRALKEAYRD